ncbi:MAG TPA: response regulator, partial [Methylomirabilota bacterium]|nr:response regulator [Methylomirabilota bacterium]
MAGRGLASLQVRVLLLVLLAVVPALALMLYTNLEERRLKAAQVQTDARRLSRLIAADHARLVEGARQLLVSLARIPAVRDRDAEACSALFADLLKQYPSYANFGALAPDGYIFCSGLPMAAPVYSPDRAFFRRAMETGAFAVGDFQIGRITHRATVNFGHPVLDRGGRIHAVVFSALDLAWVSDLAVQAELPRGSVLTLIDRHGTILVRYPEQAKWIGQPMPESSILRTILAQRGHGAAEAPGADGVPRLFAFAPLGGEGGGADAYVSVGIPSSVAFADADRLLARNVVALGLVAALALVAAWIGGRLFVVQPVRALVDATRRVSAGDLSARTGVPPGRGELGQLARAFDQMAESLEQAHQRRILEEELRRKNYELEQQNRSIQEANRLKTEFVSMVSHELRTPLTSIQGYVELLLEDRQASSTDERRECLTVVKNNAQRLLGLINDLLDLSRIEAGRIDLHRTSVDLTRLIREVADSVRPLIDAKRQQLALDLSDGLPAVWADADRVTQILTNLISNAHKYTPAEGRITVAARRADGGVRVDIQDTGIGLSPEEQAQLFTRFFRAGQPRAGPASGTGLGLVITRLLVELHGGNISVSSAPGQGSTFSFSLPLRQAAQEDAGPEAAVPPALPGGRVLVVDDEPDNANLIRRYLERAGLEVLLAHDGAGALRLAQAARPDLITLDIVLPDTDGFTVLASLKSDPATAPIPVMLISVLPDEGHGRRLGAVEYVRKPLQERSLIERVGRILAAGRPRRVLVADGDAEARARLAGQLRSAGYEVLEAADGMEAVALARQGRPGLVLLDLRMPNLDGAGAVRALRAEPTTRDLPVVMMTSSAAMPEESRPALDTLGGASLL